MNIVFENKTATNGAAFNFRVSVGAANPARAATSKPSPAHSSKEDSHHDSVEKDNLPTRQEKEAAARSSRSTNSCPTVWLKWKMPCANRTRPTKRLTDIETALCELDAALNKE